MVQGILRYQRILPALKMSFVNTPVMIRNSLCAMLLPGLKAAFLIR